MSLGYHNMRKQYHFRKSDKGLLAWDVDKLILLSKNFPVKEVPLTNIQELDEAFWYEHEEFLPTCKSIAAHAALIYQTDLSFPIILSSNGRVMDGMHRVCKCLIEKREKISAVQFVNDPEPDYIGMRPDDLPYD